MKSCLAFVPPNLAVDTIVSLLMNPILLGRTIKSNFWNWLAQDVVQGSFLNVLWPKMVDTVKE
jgi:hypothetical protein